MQAIPSAESGRALKSALFNPFTASWVQYLGTNPRPDRLLLFGENDSSQTTREPDAPAHHIAECMSISDPFRLLHNRCQVAPGLFSGGVPRANGLDS